MIDRLFDLPTKPEFPCVQKYFRQIRRVLGGTWPALQVFLMRRAGDLRDRNSLPGVKIRTIVELLPSATIWL